MAAPFKLTRAHRVLVGVVLAGAVVIATIGFAGSYAAVRDLAEDKGFGDFAPFFPIGIDAGIVVLLALDLLLTWLRIPFPLLRQTAWLLTAATIAFNGASAWGDPLAVAMHAVIPVLFVITVEAARHAIGRVADITADRHMEGVRLWRWILAPVPTFRLWRRMKLWELRSYEEVIRMERDRLVYRAHLRAVYGRGWRRKAPMDARMPLRLARYGVPVTEGRQLVEQRMLPRPAAEGGAAAAGGEPRARAPEPAVEAAPRQAPPATAEPTAAPAAEPTAEPAAAQAAGHPSETPEPAAAPTPAAEPAPAPRPDGDAVPAPAPEPEPAPEPQRPRVTVPAGPNRRRALGRAPTNGHVPPPRPAPEAVAEPLPDPEPEVEPRPPLPEPAGELVDPLDDAADADAYFTAYRRYVMEHGDFPNARQLARFLNERYGVTNPDGTLLNEQYLREYLRDFRERYNAEMGMAR